MQSGLVGLSLDDINIAHLKLKEQPLNWDYWRKEMLPQLVATSLVSVRKPEIGDKRKPHIFPLQFDDEAKEQTDEDWCKTNLENVKNVFGEGAIDVTDEIDVPDFDSYKPKQESLL